MKRTQIMGVINVTPDSYYSQSRVLESDKALSKAQEMLADGADWLDVGGESTRPTNSEPVSEIVEKERVLPIIRLLHQELRIPISIDTHKPGVAASAVEAGAELINDITGFRNPQMVEVAASCQAKLCLMHMQGTPQTMQNFPNYPDGVVSEILHWFDQQLNLLEKAGVSAKRVILDPGIGFGKTVADNLEILHNLHRFRIFGLPILLGCSRKWFLRQISGKSTPEEVLPETLAVHTLACLAGVDIIRVHDVKEHRAIAHLIAVYRERHSIA